MVYDKVIEAFHLMWGNFPEGVQLTHKNREIIALNTACERFGRVKGMVCSSHGAPEGHKGCLANQALSTQQPIYKKSKFGEREIITYWLPVDGYPELFIHFGVGVSIDYNATSEEVENIKE